MRILRFDDWIVERMKIRPVTNAELDTVKELIDKSVANTTTSQSTDYRSKKLRSIEDAAYYYNRKIGPFGYEYRTLYKDYNHTMYERFDVWDHNFSGTALIKKHQHRVAIKSLTDLKRFVTVYCAFKKYGKENNYTANEIIKIYMDDLKTRYNVTDDAIIDAFFE